MDVIRIAGIKESLSPDDTIWLNLFKSFFLLDSLKWGRKATDNRHAQEQRKAKKRRGAKAKETGIWNSIRRNNRASYPPNKWS